MEAYVTTLVPVTTGVNVKLDLLELTAKQVSLVKKPFLGKDCRLVCQGNPWF